MVKKLNELECMLNLNLIKSEEEKFEGSEYEDNYNNGFKKYILKNLEEFDEFINDWDNFKLNKKMYMKEVDKILDKCTYGQTEAKDQMKRIIGQWMNGVSKGQCFGLCGPPGVGKTTLCKNGLAKCLFDENGEERPFAFLPLGGATNGSILEGHHYTYLGSTWGKIVDILIETKCMNPIIYIDELDKISKTEHGREIISILTHITDQSQNKEFYDRYFTSIPIDLSNVLFIFSYNDRDNIDKILLDRIQEINIKPLSIREKIIISQNYIIPDILNNVGFTTSEIIFTNDI
jgi:ATP-dependent Lon protease